MKATKSCEIFPLILTTVHTVKSKGKISQNFSAFSEYMNFKLPHKLKQFQQKDDKNIFLEPRECLFAVKKFYDKPFADV